MEFINDYIKEIIGFVIIMGVMSDILPEKTNVQYVKLFTGLVLTLLLVSPVLEFFQIDVNELFHMNTQADTSSMRTEIEENLKKEYEKISNERLAKEVEQYGFSLEKAQESKGVLKLYVSRQQSTKNQIAVERIIIEKTDRTAVYPELVRHLSQLYGIEETKIILYEV